MYVSECACHSTPVEVRGQLARAGSLLLGGSQGSTSGHYAWRPASWLSGAISPALTDCIIDIKCSSCGCLHWSPDKGHYVLEWCPVTNDKYKFSKSVPFKAWILSAATKMIKPCPLGGRLTLFNRCQPNPQLWVTTHFRQARVCPRRKQVFQEKSGQLGLQLKTIAQVLLLGMAIVLQYSALFRFSIPSIWPVFLTTCFIQGSTF